MADAIRRHLETILDKGNAPAHQNRNSQGRVLVLQMPVPGDGHEDVGHRQQKDRVHGLLSEKVNGQWSLEYWTVFHLLMTVDQ